MVSINEAIHEYMGRGWSIIPIRTGDKRPLLRWEEFQHRHPSEAEARDWFHQWPEAGIGVVTGAISGLVVVDVDAGHGGDEALKQLELEHGPMPTTVECRTGGGGRHLYFAHPGGLVRNKVGLAPGIDIRADGGYVVAPPSLHASGLQYVWVEGRSAESIGIAPLPDWILRQARRGRFRRGGYALCSGARHAPHRVHPRARRASGSITPICVRAPTSSKGKTAARSVPCTSSQIASLELTTARCFSS
jgi:hypothetical protein